ncbi:MAG: hypothetical protein IT160_20390 [Bryobacterales bacterium]|nr:hypothetical protein [Bryobacterales bacterium]
MLKAAGRFAVLLAAPLLTTVWAQNVFVFPYTPSTPTIAVYSGDPLSASPVSTWTVGPYLNFVASNTAGTKYYFGTGKYASQSRVYVVDGSSGSTLKQLNFSGTITYMKMAPDGVRLVIWSGGLHVIDTNADVEITPPIPNFGTPVAGGIAFTPDGTKLLALVSPGSGAGRLYSVNLATNSLTGVSADIPAAVTALTVAPSGLAYVSAAGGVYEINPETMVTLNIYTIALGTLGPVAFTPDGKLGLTSDLSGQNNISLYVLDLVGKSVKATANGAQSFDSIIPVSNSRAIGFSNGFQSVFDIPLDTPKSMVVPAWGGINFNGIVRGVIASGDVPPKYVYVLTLGTLYRVDVKASALAGQAGVTIPQAYHMELAGAVSTNPVASLLGYNDAQSLIVGGTPMNLVARALDLSGRPVSGATVTFTVGSPLVAVGSPGVVTNADGFAQTSVTVPATAGTYTVTGQSGAASRTYTINVGIVIGGGGDNGGGETPVSGGLSIISGQGQVLRQFDTTFVGGYEPLAVQLLDSGGTPISGADLSWTVQSASGNVGAVSVTSTVTDGNGRSENNFSAGIVNVPGSIAPVTVTVSDGNGHTVVFNLVVVGNPPGNNLPPGINADVINPVAHLLVGDAGTTQQGGLKLRIYTSWGAPLENVALKIVPSGDPAQVPTATCAGGFALSDINGYATCDVVYGRIVGNAPILVKFGGGFTYNDFNLVVNVGPPSKIVAITPASLSGNPGQKLGNNALGIQVTDAGGNKIQGVPLQWTVVTAGTVTLTNAFTQTNADGQGFATPTLGSIPGPAQVKVTAGSGDNAISFTFTLTVNVQLGGLQYVSGNDQKALLGTNFLNPLVVQVTDTSGKPVQSVTVNWAITSGVGSLNTPGPTTTDANGNALVNVTAGSTAGPIVITAATGTLQAVSFTLTAIPPGPVFSAGDVVNYASNQPGVTPGGIARITGTNLAAGLNGSVVANNGMPGPWPYTLNGVTVRFGAYQAPVYAVSNVNGVQSVVVQVPFELAVGETTVTVTAGGGDSSVPGVQVKSIQPGLFENVDQSGNHLAVLARPDGTLVTVNNPALRGEILRMYVTGLGQTSPATATNAVGIPGQTVVANLIGGVAAAGALVTDTEYATGTIGVYIVSFQLPAETKPGLNVPVSIAAQKPDGSYAFSNTPVIAAVQ